MATQVDDSSKVFVFSVRALQCGLQWAWPAVEDGWTHVLLQEQVHPLCVSANPTMEKTHRLILFGLNKWIKQNSSTDFAHCNNLLVEVSEMVNLAIVVHLCTLKPVAWRVQCVIVWSGVRMCGQVSHLILTLCIRRRKEQMELCLALERRNSAYLLENSMSPSCLLRSRPADSRCLVTKWTAELALNFDLMKHFDQMNVVCCLCVWAHLSWASSVSSGFIRDSDQGASTGLSWFRKLSTSFSSLESHDKKKPHSIWNNSTCGLVFFFCLRISLRCVFFPQWNNLGEGHGVCFRQIDVWVGSIDQAEGEVFIWTLYTSQTSMYLHMPEWLLSTG